MREQSSSTLQAAIRSQGGDEGAILKRANICLGNFYDPDLDPETKAGVRESFVRALREIPLWAVLRGFDAWERSMTRRPSPGEIVILAQKELRPLTDELALRQRERDRAEQEQRERDEARMSPEAAAQILARTGFTPARMDAVRRTPMAGSFDEAQTRAEEPAVRHWSDSASADSPEMTALRRSREANAIVQEARASARRAQLAKEA